MDTNISALGFVTDNRYSSGVTCVFHVGYDCTNIQTKWSSNIWFDLWDIILSVGRILHWWDPHVTRYIIMLGALIKQQRWAYFCMIGANTLVYKRHQVNNSHHGEWIMVIGSHDSNEQCKYSVTLFKYNVLGQSSFGVIVIDRSAPSQWQRSLVWQIINEIAVSPE